MAFSVLHLDLSHRGEHANDLVTRAGRDVRLRKHADVRNAIQALRDEVYDAVLVDADVPDATTLDAIQALRGAGVPIVLLAEGVQRGPVEEAGLADCIDRRTATPMMLTALLARHAIVHERNT